ncbi:MAG: 23S rRNA (guanosine(2251)-2'-O)-methyltransferase RlmB [Chloroflexi bacterium]|nr:23S rRNA (guanosine(2251)-2'-O)-methyltransferase RlmB [Chloroflexota bacterium]MCL5274172.1 23S rRNA (guanosine(2251)-2'-O)-methyltransferase RlmB [Chloroflexota bacterium]
MERLYGRHAVHECLRAGRRAAHRLLIAEGARQSPTLRDIVTLAEGRRVRIETVQRQILDAISDHTHGVALEAADYPYASIEAILQLARERSEPPFILVLDTLQDPQNFGNLIRTADAVGAHGIIIAERRSVAVTPAVASASSGAVEHLLIARVVNLARALDELKQKDVWISALQDEPRAQDIYQADLHGALALVVGNEGDGVSRLLRDKSDFLLKLPMRGHIESLNASVAGAVALYEALRQRSRI